MSDSLSEVMTLIYPENCGQLSRKKNSIKDTDVGEPKKKRWLSEQGDFKRWPVDLEVEQEEGSTRLTVTDNQYLKLCCVCINFCYSFSLNSKLEHYSWISGFCNLISCYLSLQCSVILCFLFSVPFFPFIPRPLLISAFPFLPPFLILFLPFSLSWECVLNSMFPSGANLFLCVCVFFVFALEFFFSFSFKSGASRSWF